MNGRPLAVASLVTILLVGAAAGSAVATHEPGHDGFSSRQELVQVTLTSDSPSEGIGSCSLVDGNDFEERVVGPTDLEAGMAWQGTAGPCEATWETGDHQANGTAALEHTETWVADDLTRKEVKASFEGTAQGADGVPVTASGEASTMVTLRPTSALSARFIGSWSADVEGDASVTVVYSVSADEGATHLLGGVFEVAEVGTVDIGTDLPDLEDGVYTVHMGIRGEARDEAPALAEANADGAIDLTFTLSPIPDCDITGTPGDDVLIGTSRGERICGRGGDDVIDGRGGDDTILGGDGDDTIKGGWGDDVIDGGDGDDTITGGPGADRIEGGPGNDTIGGGRGADLILGWSGDDRIDGHGGDDIIHGMAGRDVIDGGPGDDIIWGGLDADEIAGGSGDDTIRGGWGDDEILGQGGNDRITGGDGNDVISGGAGADRLDGSAGNDVIDGGSGRDRLIGGAGDDTLRAADGERDRVFGGTGMDTAELDRRDRAEDVEEVR